MTLVQPISINGTTVPTPSDLTETPVAIQTDNVAVDGSRQRNFINSKWRVDLGWKYLTPAQLQFFNTLNLSSTPIAYINTLSNQTNTGTLSFTGLPTFKIGKYFNGAGLLVPYQLTLEQV
jgi:hypothetical protein